MAAPPANLLLAQTLNGVEQLPMGLQPNRSASPALMSQGSGMSSPGLPALPNFPNGLKQPFANAEEAKLFLQQRGVQGQAAPGLANGANGLNRDSLAALQHAAQVAAVNQAKQMTQANMLKPQAGIPGLPNMSQAMPTPNLVNLQAQAHLQALQAQQRAAQQAQQGQPNNQALNNQAAMIMLQNQLNAQQAAGRANNYPFGLQNNPIAAAAAAAAAVAATQARAAGVGAANPAAANLIQLQQAAQAAGLQGGNPMGPNAMAWAQTQALQNAAAQAQAQNLAAAQQAQNLAAALQAQQRVSQMQQAAQAQAAAAAVRPGGMPNAAQVQLLRQLQARLATGQAGQQQQPGQGPAGMQPQAGALGQKANEAQLQALRAALARNAAGRAALNAASQANILAQAARGPGMPGAGGVNGAANGVSQLQQAINLQQAAQLLQQQRNAQAAAQANALTNLANMQPNANALNGQLAALQNVQRQQQAAAMLANNAQGMGGAGGMQGASNEALLSSLQAAQAKMQLAKAMENVGAAQSNMRDTSPPGAGAQASAAANSKEQRRLALACVALQLARGGMTVEQAINSGIMGGMSVTDVKFIVECYNAERARMRDEAGGSPSAPGGPSAGPSGAGGQGGHFGGPGQPSGSQLPIHLQHLATGQQQQQQPGGPGMPSPTYGGSPTTSIGSPPAELREAMMLASKAVGAGGMGLGQLGMPMNIPNQGAIGGARGVNGSSTGGSPTQGASPTHRSSQASDAGTGTGVGGDGASASEGTGVGGEGGGKAPFDAFAYDFFGAPAGEEGGLLGALEDGGLEGELGALEGEAAGGLEGTGPDGRLRGLDLPPDQQAWLQAAADANQALWAGEGAADDDEGLTNDDLAARLANLDLGSGFF